LIPTNYTSGAYVACREDLIIELQELKKKHRNLEEAHNHVKAENQRLESDAAKQQRRIDQLLNLSDGAKNIGISSDMRRDIEKSILVRQLKNQINHLRNDLAEKENELESVKRSTKSTHVAELTFERDEYFLEVQRLKAALMEVKEELHRERQRREWNTRVAGDASEDLRREVARLSSGYQSMLANISSRATTASGQRPSTTTGTRQGPSGSDAAAAPAMARPVSAAATSSAHAHSPTKEGDRPKRPLSATPKNTPLSAYYQADHIPTVDASADPLDNFGLPGHVSTRSNSGGHAIQELLHESERTAGAGRGSDSNGIFSVGERVQGQFKGGASWYNGEIRKYNGADGTYAVQYDDGDYEADVPLARLRAIAATPAATESAAPSRPMPALVPTLAPAPASHPALMGGTYVSPSAAAKPKPTVPLSAAPYKVGEKIEALYYKGTTWYGGKITAVHPSPNPAEGDFVFDVGYDDGDRELKVPVSNIRRKEATAAPPQPAASTCTTPAPAPAAPTQDASPRQSTSSGSAPAAASGPAPAPVADSSGPAAKFKVGDKVEGHYGGGPSWYPGKVGKVTTGAGSESTYTVEYDDGDREVNVAESNVRLAPASTTASPRTKSSGNQATSNPYKNGDRVQGYFDDLAAWFDGTVAAVNADGTCHITYDDGDEEETKPISKIRLVTAPASSPKQSSPAKPAAAPAPAPAAATTAKAPTPREPSPVESLFKVHDRVEARYGNGDTWYPAVVTKVTNPGLAALYSLEYDDGDTEDLVDDSCIRLMPLPKEETPQKQQEAPRAAPAAARKPSIVNTNLDSFLNELSDDEDSTTGLGNLDSGRGLTLRNAVDSGAVNEDVEKVDGDDAYDEDFDA
jgi:predicted  nucleic acid-binding Zn-ribbon protein